MCQNVPKLTFCSCDTKLKLFERRPPNEYTWHLTKYLGQRTYQDGERRIIGKIQMPKKQLSKKISLDVVLKELNSRNCFDFDYTPQEMDCLNISGNGGYFRVRFVDNQWESGSYPVFSSDIETIDTGKIKFL